MKNKKESETELDVFLENIPNIKIPLRVIQEIVEDLLVALESDKHLSINRKEIENNFEYYESLIGAVHGAVVYSSLMVSTNKSIDFNLVKPILLVQTDDVLCNRLCKEVITRTLNSSKEILKLSSVSVSLVKERMRIAVDLD